MGLLVLHSCTAASPGTCNHFKDVTLGTHGDGLDEAVNRDALGQLHKLGRLEGLAGVGGGLVNLVDGDELESATGLHVALLWAG